ncbi:hypothetical protein [Mesorhizobium sp. B2-6-5]|nr:hypothetical protein [Mesorhizobium sp. B2-6-5]
MRSAWNGCLVFVGSLNRETPYFHGAGGAVSAIEISTPMCVKIVA